MSKHLVWNLISNTSTNPLARHLIFNIVFHSPTSTVIPCNLLNKPIYDYKLNSYEMKAL